MITLDGVVSLQVDNQLPFSVYPQVLYPLPPPPTVASTCGKYLDPYMEHYIPVSHAIMHTSSVMYTSSLLTSVNHLLVYALTIIFILSFCLEPKPFIEASVVVRRSDKVSMAHIQSVLQIATCINENCTSSDMPVC